MNKAKLLDHLLNYIAQCPIGTKKERSLEEDLLELNNRKAQQVVLPLSLPADPDDAIPLLRQLYKEDVSKASLVLSHLWPDEFIFYRVSAINRELFRGFEFLAEVVPEFDFPFEYLRKNAFEDYLLLNDRLWEFGESYFADCEPICDRIHMLIYAIIPWMFVETSEYNRYWINATSKDVLSYDSEVSWTGRKNMRHGDLVFMYEQSPTKAIQSLFVVQGSPWLDPWGPWDGIWVKLQRICEIPPITFSWMRQHDHLKDWSVIRRQFQGVITEPVPHACYNELLTQVPDEIREEWGLLKEPVAHVAYSGEFATEAEFEDEIIDARLRGWGLVFQRQYPVKCYFGTQRITGYVDFLILHQGRPVALFENKLRIINEQQLRSAINQGKSYSLMLGIQCFVVGAPEGLRLYRLNGTQEELLSEWSIGNKAEEEQFRSHLLTASGISST